MSNKYVSMKLNSDFRRAYKKGAYKVGRFLVVYVRKNGQDHNKLGIATGKRFGNSVQRNRIKRLIRESYRCLKENIGIGYDVVIMVRASKREALPGHKLKANYVPTYNEIYPEVRKLLDSLGLLH